VVSTISSSRSEPFASRARPLERGERADECYHLLGHRHLGQRDHEAGRQPARLVHERRHEQVQRAERPLGELGRQRLDADADEGRERRVLHPARDLEAVPSAWPSSSASGRFP
jgi:hypothetical protein